MKNSLKYVFTILLLILIQTGCSTSNQQQVLDLPAVDEIASAFTSPPVEYSMTFYWGWDGNVTEEVIARDLDAFKARNVNIVTLEPGYGMGFLYLSPGWFERVSKTVELARERDMRVWLVDEGKYPSGFAGGKFSAERPDLRMQALVVADRFTVAPGETVSRRFPPETLSAVAVRRSDNSTRTLTIEGGELNWTAPEGDWQILVVQHDFRTSQTRAVNNPSRGKDTSNSLCDYLDPDATKQFIEFTHEEYKKYVGSEFGKTVLGFRGDEPDYSIRGIPYTPDIFAEFKKRKGYDVQPYTATFFAPRMTEEQKRVKADYWDVWSDLFSENFFGVQANWCSENNLQYLVHLNKEDDMPLLIAHEGDFFKSMRHVQMPGVDAIWDQIWPGKVTDYPKYASSAAHLFGKPRAFTESFAAYDPKPNVQQAKWILDHQFARGINMVEVMFVPASSSGRLGLSGWLTSDEFPDVAAYINRVTYTLSQGRPAAQIALYHPTTSMWMGDDESNKSVLAIARSLLERQHDFDFVDDRSLSSLLKHDNGKLVNLSGQAYRAVIIPSITVISQAALDKLRTFKEAGGEVIFLGRTPTMVVEKTFLDAAGPPELDWAIIESSGKLADRVMGALPKADVSLDKVSADVKYTHRKWRDADVYFFFNENTSDKYTGTATLAGNGKVQVWDAMTGDMKAISGSASEDGFAQVPLELEPSQTTFIIIGSLPSN